jgi:hypothetical protein
MADPSPSAKEQGTQEQLHKLVIWLNGARGRDAGAWCAGRSGLLNLQGRHSDWDKVGAIYEAFVRDGMAPMINLNGINNVVSFVGGRFDGAGETPLEAALSCAMAYIDAKATGAA